LAAPAEVDISFTIISIAHIGGAITRVIIDDDSETGTLNTQRA
jgi:hypothetical protein